MKQLIFFAVVVFVAVSCDKDKFMTKPQLEVDSYNTKELAPNSNLVITLKYTDKEGDLSKGDMYININRINTIPIPPACQGCDSPDTLRYKLAEFPQNPEGFITVTLPHSSQQFRLKEHPSINDTIQFKFAVADIEGNKSDTITSDPIVILK
jgi:hypothetical protein